MTDMSVFVSRSADFWVFNELVKCFSCWDNPCSGKFTEVESWRVRQPWVQIPTQLCASCVTLRVESLSLSLGFPTCEKEQEQHPGGMERQRPRDQGPGSLCLHWRFEAPSRPSKISTKHISEFSHLISPEQTPHPQLKIRSVLLGGS